MMNTTRFLAVLFLFLLASVSHTPAVANSNQPGLLHGCSVIGSDQITPSRVYIGPPEGANYSWAIVSAAEGPDTQYNLISWSEVERAPNGSARIVLEIGTSAVLYHWNCSGPSNLVVQYIQGAPETDGIPVYTYPRNFRYEHTFEAGLSIEPNHTCSSQSFSSDSRESRSWSVPLSQNAFAVLRLRPNHSTFHFRWSFVGTGGIVQTTRMQGRDILLINCGSRLEDSLGPFHKLAMGPDQFITDQSEFVRAYENGVRQVVLPWVGRNALRE